MRNRPDAPQPHDTSETGSLSENYFETRSCSEMESLFAGNTPENLKTTAGRFGVSITARENWIRIDSPDPASLKSAREFLTHLLEIVRSSGTPLTQHDFEHALSAHFKRGSAMLDFFANRLSVSKRKGEIVPRTENQLAYVKSMREHDAVFALGPAGTGKTYLAVAMAVNSLLSGTHERIVLVRPAVEAGENLGFLPGGLEEKINPYLRPLYDALREMLEPKELEDMRANGMIELAPLAFMRGRTLNKSFIILDEAQNATNDQMLMFLTRLGFKSKCVACGDPSQTDLPQRTGGGLERAVRLLSGIDGVGICRLGREDVLRHSLVERIIKAYDSDRAGQTAPKEEA